MPKEGFIKFINFLFPRDREFSVRAWPYTRAVKGLQLL